MNDQNRNIPPADSPVPPDELDALLRQWHTVNATRAAAGRDRLLESLAREGVAASDQPASSQPELKPTSAGGAGLPSLLSLEPEADPVVRAERRAMRYQTRTHTSVIVLRKLVMNRYFPAAALMALAVLMPFLLPSNRGGPKMVLASHDNTLLCPEGGRLDAFDDERNALGPCALKHTDVIADVSGFLTRVTVKQKYHNPHPDKIEAVYTFPLSNNAAVDRMNMTIGDRVIIGQVKERQQAREIYQRAKDAGQIASLLEQERPNIFTQSIANIEPGASIDIEISYIEITQQENGQFSFEFPTVVGPRYVPGIPLGTIANPPLWPDQRVEPVPEYVKPRRGIVLLAPATISGLTPGDLSRGSISAYQLAEAMKQAQPIRALRTNYASVWYNFRAAYGDGSIETGTLYTDGTGTLNSRWFYCPPAQFAPRPMPEIERGVVRNDNDGGGFAPDTNQVPDASRITPMPVRPPNRAGHDISITVNIDTGGPALLDVNAPLHEVVKRPGAAQGDDGPAAGRTTVTLANRGEIPNRDFVLRWKQAAAQVEPSVFAHTAQGGLGSFFSVTLLPPERVDDTMAVPRELVFVLDTSGSMNGFPIEKAKAVIAKAIDSMRSFDTFNLITFAGDTKVLWNRPRPATQANRDEAQQFLATRSGGGGTEMMKAINAALEQRDWARPAESLPRPLTPDELANLPADGREVRLVVPSARFARDDGDPLSTSATYRVATSFGTSITVRARGKMWAIKSDTLTITGRWSTDQGDRYLDLTAIDAGSDAAVAMPPVRIVMFLTDGLVGNDMAIIDAIQRNRATTRVFSFGIGNSVNRYLLDGMARAGAGEVEYVLLSDGADAAVDRFTTRIRTPVLTNINVQFSPNIQVEDALTALGAGGGGGGVADLTNIPDLFDVKPLTIVGKYTSPARGTVTISGNTAAGPWSKTIDLNLPAEAPAHDTVATLWARTKVESIMNANLSGAQRDVLAAPARAEIVSLGEKFALLTQYTSFVAVDRLRVTYGGKARLVHIPIELPQGTNFHTIFGGGADGERDRYEEGERLGYRYGFDGGVGVPEIDLQGLLQASQDGGGAGQSQFVGSIQAGQEASSAGAWALSLATPPPPTGAAAEDVARFRRADTTELLRARIRPADREQAKLAAAEAAGAAGPAGVETAGKPAPSQPAPQLKSDGKSKDADEGAQLRVGAVRKAQETNKPADAAGEKKEAAPPAPARSPAPATEEARKQAERGGGAPPAADPAPAPAAREPSPDNGRFQYDKNGVVITDDLEKMRDNVHRLTLGEEQQDRSSVARNELATMGVPVEAYKEVALPGWKGAADGPITSHDQRTQTRENAPSSVRLVLPQQALRYSTWLVKEHKLDDARRVSGLLAEAVPTYQPGIELHDTLADEQLAEPERNFKLSQLDAQAELDIKEIMRRATLLRRIDPALHPYVFPADPAGALDSIAPPEGATITERGILLTILVKDAGKETLAALAKAGLHVEHTDTRINVIVGTVPLGKIADVTLVDGIRKVEPTRE